MKVSTQALFLLLGSVSGLRFESNIPGLTNDLKLYSEVVEWAHTMTIGGGPVDYVGLFQGDDIEFEDEDQSVGQMLEQAKSRNPGSLDAFAPEFSKEKIHCPLKACLNKREDNGFTLSKRANDGKLINEGCKKAASLVPISAGGVFALIGGSLCAATTVLVVPCTVVIGMVGGALGDLFKDDVVDKFCTMEEDKEHKKCGKKGFGLDCKDNQGNDISFRQTLHKPGYTCKDINKAGYSGSKKVTCRKIKN